MCSKNALSIPIYPELSEEQKNAIVEKTADFYSNR